MIMKIKVLFFLQSPNSFIGFGSVEPTQIKLFGDFEKMTDLQNHKIMVILPITTALSV